MFIFYEFLFEMPREALFIMLCYEPATKCYNCKRLKGMLLLIAQLKGKMK